MSLLGVMQAAVDGAVAAAQAVSPAWEEATVTIPGGAALAVTVAVFVDEQPHGSVQRRSATVLVAKAECPDEPVDGTTIVTASDTWTVRTALEQSALWRTRVWA